MSIVKRAGVKYEYFGSKKQSTLPPNKHFTVSFVAKLRAFEGRFKQCMQGRTNSTLQSLLGSFGGLQKFESSSEGKKSWFGFLWKDQNNSSKRKQSTSSARPTLAAPSVPKNRSHAQSPRPKPNPPRRPRTPGHHGGKRSSTRRAKPASPFPTSRSSDVGKLPPEPPAPLGPPATPNYVDEPSPEPSPEPLDPPEPPAPFEPIDPPEPVDPPEPPEQTQQSEETEKSVPLPSMESKKAKGMFDDDDDAFNDNFSNVAKQKPKATSSSKKNGGWFPSVLTNFWGSKEKVYKPDFSKKGPEVEMGWLVCMCVSVCVWRG